MPVNSPERSRQIALEMDVPELYARCQTGLAMAKNDAWKLRGYLQGKAYALRAEADEIERMLVTSTEQVDSWYDAILAEKNSLDLKK